MTHSTANISDDTRRLVDAALDETIERNDWDRLCDTMRRDRDVRGYYIARRSLHAGLMWEARNSELSAQPAKASDSLSLRERAGVRAGLPPRTAVFAIAAALLITAGAVAIYGLIIAPTSETRIPQSPPVAVLTGSTGGVLIEPHGGDVVNVGSRVAAGGYELGDGRIEVALDSGVEAAIIGPAEFRLDTPTHTTLNRGRLTALAKPGYTVRTPGVRVVDLGTAFAVDVDASGATRVECLRGRVLVETINDQGVVTDTRELTGWQTMTVGERAEPEALTPRFRSLADLPGDDPMEKLVAWYPFEGDGRNAVDDALHATEAGEVTYTEGRSGMAATFAGTIESFIDLPIDATPESMPKLTWGAWVKPTALAGGNREVLSTDAGGFRRALSLDPRNAATYPKNAQAPLRVGAFAGARGVVASTGPAPEPNEWRFVAAVYDAESQTVTVYTDDPVTGELIATTDGTIALTGGRPIIRVGNHLKAENEAFAGQIDDVFVIADALDAYQIKTLFREGFVTDADISQPVTGGTADRP